MNSDMNFKSADEIQPYPGLRPFQYKENYLFFGREGKAQEIASRLQHSHFVAVVGTSGSGKSSLVRAGLLPLLYGGMLYESGSHWRIAIMRPEETPIHNLAEALTYPVDFETEENGIQPRDENQIAITEATLRRSGVGLLDFIKNPANEFEKEENLLVVVDQFEELFRFKEKSSLEDAEEAAAFVKLLLEATRDKKSRIFVVITMRSDFLGDCAEFRDLPEAINDGQYLIPRMTREQLRQSIESPAFVGDARVSPALVNRLLNDLEEQNQSLDLHDRIVNDHLPVLQHALMRTWDLWKAKGEPDKPIDVEHYDNEKIGGMTHALSRHADEAFNELSAPQKLIAEKMFKCLTETDSENRETRRPSRIEEICAVTGAGEKEVGQIIEVFRKEGRTFLMPPPNVTLTKETKIDISHESLIRNWETLKAWVKDETGNARQYRRISEDALLLKEYRENNQNFLSAKELEENCKDFLWRGIELKDALSWRDDFKPNIAWASRYQSLTEKEKIQLDELARFSPAQEPEARRKFIHNHFVEVMAFLDQSAEYDHAKQVERERHQEEILAFEREKAQAAENLAAVEREKAATLQTLTESLKRQRRILSAVSVFSILLMLAATVLAIVALRARAIANTERGKADEQRQIAEENLKVANEQREFAKVAKEQADKNAEEADRSAKEAEKSAKEADKSAKEAEENAAKAEQQKKIAEGNLVEANKQRQIADSERKKAEDLTKEVEKEARATKAALKKVETEQELNKTNLEALSSYENSNYETAEGLLKDLLGKTDENQKEQVWWIRYNLAKTHHQLGNYDEAKANFDKALGLVGGVDNNNSMQPAPVNFFPASYDSSKDDDKDDVLERRITTLRRLAQFYRNCADAPEDCFDTLALNKPGRRLLYERAIKNYEDLIKIRKPAKDPTQTERMMLNEVNDLAELADTQVAFGQLIKENANFINAERNYLNAIRIIRTLKQPKPLFIISLQKKLLTSALYQNDLTDAALYAKQLLEEKEKTFEPETLPYEIRMVDTYRDLARVYGDYRQELSEEGEAKVQEIRRQRKYELDKMFELYVLPSAPITEQAQKQVNAPAPDKSSKADDTEDKIKRLREVFETNESITDRDALKKSLDELKSSLDESAEVLKFYTAISTEYATAVFAADDEDIEDMIKALDGKMFADDLKIIMRLMARENNFTNIATVLKRLADAAASREEDFDIRQFLARLYATNNDYCKAYKVIADADNLSDSHYQENKSNADKVRARLSNLRDIAEFYQSKLSNSEKYIEAVDNYKKVLTEAEAMSLKTLSTLESKLSYVEYYKDGGQFLYKQGGSANYSKALELFIAYSDFLKRSEPGVRENRYSHEWGKEKVFLERVKAGILIGLTYEKTAEPGEAAVLYKNLLTEIESHTSLKPKPTPTPAATVANVSTTNANASVTNANIVTNANTNVNANTSVNVNANANVAAISNVNTPANIITTTGVRTSVTVQTSPLEPLIKEAAFLEAYLRTRLAALHLSRGENVTEALKLLTEKAQTEFINTQVFSYQLYSIENYASALVTIGDFMRDKRRDNQLAAQYYERAAKALQFIDDRGKVTGGDIENYVLSSPSDGSYSRLVASTKEFYNEYLRVLTRLKDAGGNIKDFDKEIARVEEKKKKAPSFEKPRTAECKETGN